MKNLSSEAYSLDPYKIKRIFWFVYGIYFEDTLICYGGSSKMFNTMRLLNGAFLNGICHSIVINN